MKQFSYGLFFIIFLLCLPINSFAQELIIEPFFSTFQYMNDVIDADTTSTGERAHSVYVLRRDSIYLINGIIRNDSSWAINIKAEDGSGGKPVIFFANVPGGTTNPGNFIQNSGDVWLKDLIIETYIESEPDQKGNMNNMIQTAATGTNITIDGCIFLNVDGQFVRTNSSAATVRLTNCIFADMGYEGSSNFGAGKGVDLRAGACDSLIIQQCTFVNVQDRIVRHLNSTGQLNHFIFDHNTIVNSMAYHGMLSLGWVGSDVKITNNLFVDPFAAMADTDYTRQLEFITNETDPFGNNRMTWVFTDTAGNAVNTAYTISHNYYAISDSGQAFYNRWVSGNPPFPSQYSSLPEGPALTYYINSKLGADSVNTFTKDNNIKLTNTPYLMTKLMDWYRTPIALGGAGKTKQTGTFTEDVDMDRRTYTYFQDTLDCSYLNSLPAYTGSTEGYPVGDLNWFPSFLSVETLDNTPANFELLQNYPNPFNPSTKITFKLQESGMTRLSVYNLLGEKVETLVNEELPVGTHQVVFDASKFSSGVYFYKLEAGNHTSVKKMMLLK
jgi:Secretion system C-terminal sorting domain